MDLVVRCKAVFSRRTILVSLHSFNDCRSSEVQDLRVVNRLPMTRHWFCTPVRLSDSTLSVTAEDHFFLFSQGRSCVIAT